MKRKLESNRGITIISLVVTIIVLIILASVTISVMIGKNSVLDVTKTEKYNTQRSMLVETLRMELLDRQKEELEPLKDNEISEVLEKHGKVIYTDKEEIDGVIVNEEFDIKLSEIWENSYREEHIKLEVEGYTGIYDGKAHNAIISVTTNPEGATVEYAIENGKYSSTIPQVTDANTYSISIRATKEGYIKAEKTVTVTVRPQTNTRGNLVLSETSGTITYPNNGAFTVTKNTSGGALSVKSSDESVATASISGTTVTITPKAITTDGKKTTITVTSAATSNYEAQTATYEVTINRGTIDLDATPYSGNYDGKAHNALTAISTNPTGTTIEYSLNGGAYSTTMPQVTGASTYSISIRATKEGYIKAEKTVTVTVRPQTNTRGNLVLSETSGTITYPNNGAFTVTKNTSGGALSVKSSDESVATASISGTTVTITPKAITTDGKKTTIIVTSAATSNYEAQTAKYEVTINRGTIDLDATIYTGVYDGQSHDAVSNIKVVPNDAKVEYSIDGGKTYTTAIPKVTNAGEFAVTIKANKAGYKEKVITKEKGKIDRQKSATVSTKNGTYDGTMQTGITGENVEFSGTVSAINAGEYKANVTPKSDYAWSDGSTDTKEVTFTINKRTLTVTAEAKTKTYGEANPALTYKITGAVSGQTAKFNGSLACSATATSGVGTYDITQGTLALVDNGTFLAGNYQIAYTGAKLTVNAKNASTFTATLATTSYTYDGTAKTPAVTVKDGSTTLTNGTHYTVAYSNNVNAGTGKVTITGKENYTGTKELTFTIGKRAITVTAGSSSKTYNGTALTNSSATLTAGSLASGQTLTASATGTITNVGSVANTVSTAVVKNSAGTDVSANYTITKVNGTLTINKATGTLSLSATSGTITYPSNGSFTITSNTSGGTLSVTSSDTSVATASISGTTVTITPKVPTTDGKKTTITVTSAATSNYVAQSKTYEATVNRGELEVSFTTYNGVYDGNAHNAITNASYKPSDNLTITSYLDGVASAQTPTIKDAKKYSVAIKVERAGYVPKTVTKDAEITRAKTASASAANKTYSGGEQTGVTGAYVTWTGTTKATNAGSYTAYATPKANYAWSDGTTNKKIITWKISPKSITDCTITLDTTDYTYNGVAKQPTVTVKDGSTILVKDTEYTVVYSNNINVGTASVAVSGKGNYNGAVTKTFTIKDSTPPNITLTQTNTTAKEYQKTVSVSATDSESEISIIKYASGSKDVSYFANNGTVLSESTFNVSTQDYTTTILENDISTIVYTVYAKNKVGLESVKTITISNLLIDYTMKYGSGSVAGNGATADSSGNITLPEYNSVQFGPYVTLPAGTYEISYTGSNLSNLRYLSYTNSTGEKYLEEILGVSHYTVTLTETKSKVEFVAYNNASTPVVITGVKIKQLNNYVGLYRQGKSNVGLGDEFINWNKATGNYVNFSSKYIELVCPNDLAILTFNHLIDYYNYKYLYLVVNKEIDELGYRTVVRSDYPIHVNDSSYDIARLTSPGVSYNNGGSTVAYKFDVSKITQKGYFCVTGWNGANNGLKVYELYLTK